MNMKRTDDKKKYLELKEAAKYLGYSAGYFRNYFRSLEQYGVQAYRPLGGRKYLFKTEDLDRYIDSCVV